MHIPLLPCAYTHTCKHTEHNTGSIAAALAAKVQRHEAFVSFLHDAGIYTRLTHTCVGTLLTHRELLWATSTLFSQQVISRIQNAYTCSVAPNIDSLMNWMYMPSRDDDTAHTQKAARSYIDSVRSAGGDHTSRCCHTHK